MKGKVGIQRMLGGCAVAALLALGVSGAQAAPGSCEDGGPTMSGSFIAIELYEDSSRAMLGLALSPSGALMVGTANAAQDFGQGNLTAVNVDTGAPTVVLTGFPMSQPGEMAFGDGHAILGDFLVIGDHNMQSNEECCGGLIFGLTPGTFGWDMDFTASQANGNLRNFAVPPAGSTTWPDGMYHTDFGTSDFATSPSSLRRLNLDGSVDMLWNPNAMGLRAFDLVFGPGGDWTEDILVVADDENIYAVAPDGSVSIFSEGDVHSSAIAFGPGGAFGTNLFAGDQEGNLYEIASDGSLTLFASGFAGPPRDLEFTPNGDRLYVSIEDTVFVIDAGTCGGYCDGGGDANGDGAVNVLDTQCIIQWALWHFGGEVGAPPACAPDFDDVDANCDGDLTIQDVQIGILGALGVGLPSAIDADGNGCADTCDG